MNRNLIRYSSIVATLAISFSLAVPASAELSINQVDDAARLQLVRDQAGAATEEVRESPNGIYIIQMIGDPVVAYEGGIKGLKATKPNKGKKINPNSRHVIDYVSHLNGKHAQALNSVGGGQNVGLVQTLPIGNHPVFPGAEILDEQSVFRPQEGGLVGGIVLE